VKEMKLNKEGCVRLALASQSKKRLEILEQAGFDVEVVHVEVEEKFDQSLSYQENVLRIAEKKVALASKFATSSLVLGLDTITFCGSEVFFKPRDADDARRMLNAQSGRWVDVATGVCLFDRSMGKSFKDVVLTCVKLKSLFASDIENYIKSEEWMGRAGGMDVEGRGSMFVEEIRGCFYNILGLPISRLHDFLRELGYL
jgi:septum formation protein